ncbi:GspH/FimT family pseudopilin [Salicola sp. Rm-C-2C1-2]|uniref:GspH/FimT family pseudopilin n=1 Tax=Salicola sp. Rm-C-2C1-2 TaxID=3141321 RepID=UPI0032E4752A
MNPGNRNHRLRLSWRGSQGLTLVELMIVVAITGVMAAIAVPAFDGFISRNRITATTNDLVGALNLARSEAASRGESVDVVPLKGDWAKGVSLKANGASIHRASTPEGVEFSGQAFTFRAVGEVQDGSGKCLEIIDGNGSGRHSVTVSPAGQVRSKDAGCGP